MSLVYCTVRYFIILKFNKKNIFFLKINRITCFFAIFFIWFCFLFVFVLLLTRTIDVIENVLLDQSNADSIFIHQHRIKHVCITLTIFTSNKYVSLSTTVSFINKIIRSINMKIVTTILLIAATALTVCFAAEEDKKGMFIILN
jgi:hypothetical protein